MTTATVPTSLATDTVTAELSRLLADTYTLSLKTQGYHWNVIGPQFPALHRLFEDQYTELADAIDVIAERIRARGAFAPGSFHAMERLASISDEDAAPDAAEMLARLIEAHEVVARTASSVLAAAEAAGDTVTVDLATERLTVHEKTLWMLRATAA